MKHRPWKSGNAAVYGDYTEVSAALIVAGGRTLEWHEEKKQNVLYVLSKGVLCVLNAEDVVTDKEPER